MNKEDGIRVVLRNGTHTYTQVLQESGKDRAIAAVADIVGWSEYEVVSTEPAPGAFGPEPAGVPLEEG